MRVSGQLIQRTRTSGPRPMGHEMSHAAHESLASDWLRGAMSTNSLPWERQNRGLHTAGPRACGMCHGTLKTSPTTTAPRPGLSDNLVTRSGSSQSPAAAYNPADTVGIHQLTLCYRLRHFVNLRSELKTTCTIFFSGFIL